MIKLSRKENCCGCSACVNICPVDAIKFLPDIQGFLYPEINSQVCINCGKCEAVCPIINNPKEKEFSQDAYLLQHKDKKILSESTSGGAFSAIAKIILDKGGVVFGAGFDENFCVVHKCAEDFESLKIFRNSKYVQSDKKRTFCEVKNFLDAKRFVLFSGTPCEVEGLLNFLGNESNSPLLLTVDIVCHAVPSPAVWKAFLKIEREKNNDIINLRFRDKSKYGYAYSQFAVLHENSRENTFEGIETNIMMRAFFSNVCDRPSCYECAFKKRYRRSDFTLWDCWDAVQFTRNHKKFSGNAGITRMLVHTDRGRKFLSEILAQCVHEKINADDAVKYSSKELTHSVKFDAERSRKFWAAFVEDPDGTLKKFFPQTFKTKLEAILRRVAYKSGAYSFIRGTYKKLFGDRKR